MFELITKFSKSFQNFAATRGKNKNRNVQPSHFEDIKIQSKKPRTTLAENGACGFDLCGFSCNCRQGRC